MIDEPEEYEGFEAGLNCRRNAKKQGMNDNVFLTQAMDNTSAADDVSQ